MISARIEALTRVEKRKAWIYEVPLHELHSLRNSVNDPAMTAAEIKGATLKFNLPTVAGAIKLYLLELNPPVLGWEGWEDAKAIYPSGQLALLSSDR